MIDLDERVVDRHLGNLQAAASKGRLVGAPRLRAAVQRRPPEATPLEAVAEGVEEDLGAFAGFDQRLRQQRRVGPLRVVLEDQPLVRRRPTVRNEHERLHLRARRRETRDEGRGT